MILSSMWRQFSKVARFRLSSIPVKPETPLLVVFSAPRTGSNHLFDYLAAREGVTSLSEVFNNATRGLSKEERSLRRQAWGRGAEAAKVAAEHPVESLAFVDKLRDTRLAAVKIQPRHLDVPGPAGELIDACIGHVFLRRNPLAVWISRKQARTTRIWAHANTESEHVTFSGIEFAKSTRASLSKLDLLEQLCHERGFTPYVLTYRELCDMESPGELWDELHRAFPRIEPEPLRSSFVPNFVKQDSRLPFDRLTNPDEAVAWLEKHGLDYLVENSDEFSPRSVIDALVGAE